MSHQDTPSLSSFHYSPEVLQQRNSVSRLWHNCKSLLDVTPHTQVSATAKVHLIWPVKLGQITSYVTPLSVPASQGMRSVTSLWTQPQSLVQRSSPDSPTFQSGLGPSMVRKDIRWRVRSTENSADGAARLVRGWAIKKKRRTQHFKYYCNETTLCFKHNHLRGNILLSQHSAIAIFSKLLAKWPVLMSWPLTRVTLC